MTDRDRAVLTIILNYQRSEHRLPTRKELGHAANMANGQLNRHLNRLVSEGYLTPLPRGTIDFALTNASVRDIAAQ